MIRFENVHKTYKTGTDALRGVTFSIRDGEFVFVIGKSGSVYLSIPGNRSPGGKATIKLDACTREIDAISDEPIPTGKTITIVQAIGNNTYLVKSV